MKKILFSLVVFLIFTSPALASVVITGAGATFPYPLYIRWAQAYKEASGIRLNYQPIGSGGGIKQIRAKTVDFGASDKPLTSDVLAKDRLVQFPAVVGGIAPIVNLPSLKDTSLVLSGPVLADIYLGKITEWNDPKIQALNKGVRLPSRKITVVHRSDGSGTTFLFTNYLSKVSEDWEKTTGSDSAIAWPTGIGGKGNEGVASYVQRVKGAIGYVEYAYTEHAGLGVVNMKNKSGNIVTPSINSFQAAAENANWDATSDFAEILTNEPGAKSWPIAGATFILMQLDQNKPETEKAVLRFFEWAYENGQDMAIELGYVPLPASVTSSVAKYWSDKMKDNNGQPVWSN